MCVCVRVCVCMCVCDYDDLIIYREWYNIAVQFVLLYGENRAVKSCYINTGVKNMCICVCVHFFLALRHNALGYHMLKA